MSGAPRCPMGSSSLRTCFPASWPGSAGGQHVRGSDQVGAVMLKGHTLFLIDERSQKRRFFSFA